MAAQAPIPVFSSLAEIYPSRSAVLREGKRWSKLVSAFRCKYGSPPSHIVRAPGRVNVLGEHIDYSLFPVLPAALEQDILIALQPTDEPQLYIANVDPRFKPEECRLVPPKSAGEEWHVDFVSPTDGGGWDNYMKAALIEGLAEYFPHGAAPRAAKGIKILVDGCVPAGAGLSSSAAMVVGSSIAFLVANDLTATKSKGDVVHMAMASEHRMGLKNGGMDQAASALSLPSTLLHLDFFPSIEAVPLPLPPSLAVVITNSLAAHELTDSAPRHYNLRVIESLCANRILLHAWGLDREPYVLGKKKGNRRVWLREVLSLWAKTRSDLWKATEDEIYQAAIYEAERVLWVGKGSGWHREEMIAASGLSKEDFEETYLHYIPIEADEFYLYERVLHCLTESRRVARFTRLCRQIENGLPADAVVNGDAMTPLQELGQLLTQSHESCRTLYDCTHKMTDQLQQLCLRNGALGSRQTGGGWGGAVISLVLTSDVPEFLRRIKETYEPYRDLDLEKLEASAFASLPAVGAGVYIVGAEIQT